ncbi:MAG: TetR/AcrR family transcriptional regulator [Clostridia bacterium]|nr:TetR/AcrR family transcriptional regulator [Clostridia bacterium]
MRIVKKPEERRAEMVAAASKLFVQQGFVRTSVAEIVSAVDVAKGLFYYYFTTKDDMVKAVVEGFCSYLGTVAQEIADGEGTTREKIAAILGHESLRSCFTAPLVNDLCLPQHAALYMDMCDRMYEHLSPALEKIAAQGLEESGRDASQAHRVVSVGLYGLLMTARRGDMSLPGADELAQRLMGAPV